MRRLHMLDQPGQPRRIRGKNLHKPREPRLAGDDRSSPPAGGERTVTIRSDSSCALRHRFHGEESLGHDIAARKRALHKSLLHVSEADEWGIKVFIEQQPQSALIAASSGLDYLQRKASALSSEVQQRKRARSLSPEIQKLAGALEHIALETAPVGKVSGGQPGLEWQVSILLPRHRQEQFTSMVERFSRLWQGQRRIEFTGPWPPYSFVKV